MTNANYEFIVPFVETLVRLGLRHCTITPGSRNTPLSIAMADHPGVTDWSHHDERSSAFFALGMARATGVPVAVVTTSGTAAAELYPAMIEARYSRVPLLALTADRPPTLRGTGAPQTIDQFQLFGTAPRWFHESPVPVAGAGHDPLGRALARDAWAAMLDRVPGPVHINMPFEEPLIKDADHAIVTDPSEQARHRAALHPDEEESKAAAALLASKRVLVICGPQDDAALGSAVARLGATMGWPVVADPLSQVRAGTHDHTPIIASGHSLAAAGYLGRARPDVILRFGALPTSKPINQWIAANGQVPLIVVDPEGWHDPAQRVAHNLKADAAPTADLLAHSVEGHAPDGWLDAWRRADDAAAAAISGAIERESFPSEPGVVAALARSLPAGATLWTASSMPVRDVDAFMPAITRPLRLLANRGANGIDGFLSTGFGSALASADPTYLLAGDLSALYDLTALAAAARHQAPATAVVINNDGGGIFHFLPQAGSEHFERHFGTPHGLDFVRAAELFGVEARRIDDAPALEAEIAVIPTGPRLIEVRTDRSENVATHRRIQAEVEAALSSGP